MQASLLLTSGWKPGQDGAQAEPIRQQVAKALAQAGKGEEEIRDTLDALFPEHPPELVEVDETYLSNLHKIHAEVERQGGAMAATAWLVGGEPLRKGMRVDPRGVYLMNFPVDKANLVEAGGGIRWRSLPDSTGAWRFAFADPDKICCTAAFLQASSTVLAKPLEHTLLGDLHPIVRPAKEMGAAKSNGQAMALVRASVRAHLANGAVHFRVASEGGWDAADLALSGLAKGGSDQRLTISGPACLAGRVHRSRSFAVRLWRTKYSTKGEAGMSVS